MRSRPRPETKYLAPNWCVILAPVCVKINYFVTRYDLSKINKPICLLKIDLWNCLSACDIKSFSVDSFKRN